MFGDIITLLCVGRRSGPNSGLHSRYSGTRGSECSVGLSWGLPIRPHGRSLHPARAAVGGPAADAPAAAAAAAAVWWRSGRGLSSWSAHPSGSRSRAPRPNRAPAQATPVPGFLRPARTRKNTRKPNVASSHGLLDACRALVFNLRVISGLQHVTATTSPSISSDSPSAAANLAKMAQPQPPGAVALTRAVAAAGTARAPRRRRHGARAGWKGRSSGGWSRHRAKRRLPSGSGKTKS